MSQKIIGILGIGGYLGRFTAKKLLDTGHQIIGAQRSNVDFFSEYPNFQYEMVDVIYEDQLIKFIEKCDIVVNCVSPSHLYGKMIKDVICKKNKIYVDPSDMSFEPDRTHVAGRCVGSCGYIPGLSEFLAYAIAKEKFDIITRCVMYQGGFDGCSPGAFVDMILGAGNKNFYGDSYISESKVLPFSCDIKKKYITPFSKNEVILKPLINSDSINLQKKIGAKEFYFFSAYDNMETMKFFMKLLLEVSKYPKKVAAKNIRKKLQERIENNMQFGNQEVEAYLFIELEGIKNNKKRLFDVELVSKNVNKICGYFLAEVVIELILHPEKAVEGFSYGAEIVPSNYIEIVKEEIREEGNIEIIEKINKERFPVEMLKRPYIKQSDQERKLTYQLPITIQLKQ